jgi:hypothetical protein
MECLSLHYSIFPAACVKESPLSNATQTPECVRTKMISPVATISITRDRFLKNERENLFAIGSCVSTLSSYREKKSVGKTVEIGMVSV